MINLGADFASAVKAEAVVGSDRRELVCEELVDATDDFGTQTIAAGALGTGGGQAQRIDLSPLLPPVVPRGCSRRYRRNRPCPAQYQRCWERGRA